MPHGSGLAGLSEADRMAVADAMADTETLELADRSVTSLSGGERARVALARALAVAAPVLLADEPAAFLDPRYQLRILETLTHQADDGVAVVAVLQDLALAARFADRILVMHEGEIVADGAPEKALRADMLRRVFGVSTMMVERNGSRIALPWSVLEKKQRGDKD
jgi:iron complex transport system ATP-binding protein